MRRRLIVAPVTTEVVDPKVVCENEKNIRPLCGHHLHLEAQRNEKREANHRVTGAAGAACTAGFVDVAGGFTGTGAGAGCRR